MPETNPYESPPESNESLRSPAHATRQPSRRGGQDLLPLAQLGLRLLGVMFIVQGGTSLVSMVVQLAALATYRIQYANSDSVIWLAEPAAYLAAGLYLAIGGHWVLEKVFLPASRRAEYDDEPGEPTAIESAREV